MPAVALTDIDFRLVPFPKTCLQKRGFLNFRLPNGLSTTLAPLIPDDHRAAAPRANETAGPVP